LDLFLNVLLLLVLTIWIGGMFAFGALVAPALFRSLERAEAGRLAALLIGRLDSLGLVASGMVLVVVALQGIAAAWPAVDLLRLLLVLKLLSLTLVSVMGIRPKMEALRAAAGGLYNLPDADERRLEFSRLHRLSSSLFVVNLALGILLVGLTAAR
jgi:uncharacterized membrane protein